MARKLATTLFDSGSEGSDNTVGLPSSALPEKTDTACPVGPSQVIFGEQAWGPAKKLRLALLARERVVVRKFVCRMGSSTDELTD